jgi:predicted glycosyltransferase
LIVGSVRDILVRQPRPDRLVEMLGWAEDFDRLLVHGDPDLVPFSRTFPARDRLGDRLLETGYVVEPPPMVAAGGDGEGEIVVSTGGGRVGQRLIEVALAAAERLAIDAESSGTERLRWRLLVGHGVAEETVRALNARAVAGLVVERARSDFSVLLGRAALSISQGGYNTVMEVLAAGCPAIIVPFAAGEEAEQTLRARLLAERGLLVTIDEASVDADSLARAVTGLLGRGRLRSDRRPRMDGAAYTARLLGQLLAQPESRICV